MIPMLVLALLCGSLPFSVWLTRLFLRQDVRHYGDGNPGAANAFRAGSAGVGVLVLLLDIGKAAAPVGWAYLDLGYRGLPMFLIAMAPLLGHAFSPFLRFRGGKALAVTLGVWIGLTVWRIPLAAVVLVVLWYKLLDVAGWAVMLALAGMAVVLLICMPDPMLLAVLVGQVGVLSWTHRADLRQRPHLRPMVARWLGHAKD